MDTQTTLDRRSGYDRRKLSEQPPFPFFDANNTLVREDRRSSTSRRRVSQDTLSHEPQTLTEPITQKLFLWHNDNIQEISSTTEGIKLGRSSECDLIFRNRYTSRVHARMEYHDGQFYLIDQSTNGTYLKTEEGEVFLVGEKAILSGNGLISLGTPLDYSEEGTIHFFCY